MYFVYIIKSERNGKHYIGYTGDLERRLQHHNSGANKSTRLGAPWRLVYQEQCLDKRSAWLRERQIKSYKGGRAFQKLIK